MRIGLPLLLVLLLAGAAAAHGPSVKLSYGSVSPPRLVIRAGDTVHFHNHSTTPRTFTVRGAGGSFESPAMARGEGWHHTFEEPCSFAYGVVEFPNMQGAIVVAPAEAE